MKKPVTSSAKQGISMKIETPALFCKKAEPDYLHKIDFKTPLYCILQSATWHENW